MLRRIFIAVIPSLTASTSFANDASWNCEQNKETKEWVCVGDNSPKVVKKELSSDNISTKPIEATSAPAVSSTATSELKTLEKPTLIEKSQLIETPESVQPTQSKVTTAKNAAPKEGQTTPAEHTNKKPTVLVDKESFIGKAETKSAAKNLNQPVTPAIQETSNSKKQWSCGDQKGATEWDCREVGVIANNDTSNEKSNGNTTEQPVKSAPVIQNEISSIRLLNPAFNHQQEQVFNTLSSQLAYDPWEQCNVKPGEKNTFVSSASQRESAPMEVKSNYAEVFENEIGSYSGNVNMSRADQKSTSTKANYNNASQVLDLQGDVYYSEEELALHSDTAMLNFASDQAKIRDAQFIAAAKPLRGTAKFIYRKSPALSEYKDVAYTSCRPGNQDWVIHTSDLSMNKTTGRGTVKNAWLEFKGAPVFYSPYLTFPTDNRRVSGFLMPSFGNTRYSGFRIAAPYYWNIAPNYDATITPRELINRGPSIATNFRYLTEQSKGNIALEYMPVDMKRNNDSRFYGSIKNTSTLSPNIRSNVDLSYVSDREYFAQLGSALTFSNYNYLRSSADIGYVKDGINFNTSFVNYQSINTTTNTDLIPTPYRVLPRINLNLDHAFKSMPLNTSMENEYVYFQHNHSNLFLYNNGTLDTTPVKDTNGQAINATPAGQRLNTKPSFSIPLQTSSAFITPKLSLQHTQYILSDGQPIVITPTNNNQTFGGIADTSTSRTLPILSADSGLYFDRNVSFGNSSYLHTIEPRLFYLYVPYHNQDNLPTFDTAQYDFQYAALFRENSFSGTDRIQNANQISTAISSKLIDEKTGLEKLKLDVGEIIYFEDRQVNGQVLLADGTRNTLGSAKDNYSNLVTELSSQFTRDLSAVSGLQWNPLRNDIQRVNAGIHYRNKSNEIFNIGYLYRNTPTVTSGGNDITQTDSSFRYPIYDNWSAMGRWQYSILYNKTQDALLGLEKENCCWRFRIALRRYTNNLASGSGFVNNDTLHPSTTQNGIFFEIELKGLSALGDDMDTFLQKEIYGFKGPQ